VIGPRVRVMVHLGLATILISYHLVFIMLSTINLFNNTSPVTFRLYNSLPLSSRYVLVMYKLKIPCQFVCLYMPFIVQIILDMCLIVSRPKKTSYWSNMLTKTRNEQICRVLKIAKRIQNKEQTRLMSDRNNANEN